MSELVHVFLFLEMIDKTRILNLLHESKPFFTKSQKIFSRRLKGFLIRKVKILFQVEDYLNYLNKHVRASYTKEINFTVQLMKMLQVQVNVFMINY